MYIEHNWLLYIVAFIFSFSITLVATPFAKKISEKLGAIDYPKKRGLHKVPIPRIGGIAIILGFVITIVIAMPFLEELNTEQFIGFFVGLSIIILLGIFDDIYNLKAKVKFSIQIIAALVVVYTGTRINMIMWPFSTYIENFSAPITVIWIIGVTNAVNLIDGVDGLAAGVSSICSICLMILCILTGSQIAVVFTVTLAGSCLGFLPRNFSPAEIIMGDTGSTFLGFVLAVSSIIGVFKSYAILALVIAILSMALPILDTIFAMLRRFIKGRSIMEADRGHLHHILIDKGYTHKQAVIILYILSAFSGIIAIVIAMKNIIALVVALLFILVLSFMMYVYKKRIS